MGYRRHYAILLDSKGNVIKERSNNDGDCGHAEKRVTKNVNMKDYVNGTMVIVRHVFNSNNQNVGSMSKPCKMCMKHLTHTKIKQVIYSTGNEKKPFDRLIIN
tara:strand:- start:225 stop:533 length:309 start_codon:yes stop_codon:yes gene_type:complete